MQNSSKACAVRAAMLVLFCSAFSLSGPLQVVGAESAEDPNRPPATEAARSPRQVELDLVMIAESDRLERLNAEFKAARTLNQAIFIQREIEALKQRTELECMKIQAKYLRKDGRKEAAARVDAAITELRQRLSYDGQGADSGPKH